MNKLKPGFLYKCNKDILSNKALCCKRGFIYLYEDNKLISQSNNAARSTIKKLSLPHLF